MTIEVRVPLSPTDSFFARTELLARSVRTFYPDALVTAYIGPLPAGMMPHGLPGIKCRWLRQDAVDVWKGTANEHVATMAARYAPPYSGDHILMADADIICTRRFDELFDRDGLSGVQAHVPPMSQEHFISLFDLCRAPWHGPTVEYTGYGPMFSDETQRWGPAAYWNTGIVFGPASAYAAIHRHYTETLAFLRRRINSYFYEQIALTIACAKAGIHTHQLPLRFNQPNQPTFDMCAPDELADVRFLHYLRTDTIDRDRDFASPEAIKALVARTDLTGSNEVLRRRVEELL